MIAPISSGDVADRQSVLALAESLRAWEPQLEFDVLLAQGRLYEPDGTLYAVCLHEKTTLATDRRRVDVGRGELVVIPQALAIEVNPAADFLAVRHFGPPPYHFRERFIQVWGIEHFTGPARMTATEVIEAMRDVESRHRIGYSQVEAGRGSLEIPGRGLDIHVVLAVAGAATVEAAEAEAPAAVLLRPGAFAALAPGLGFRLLGPATVVILGLATEIVHQGRRGVGSAGVRAQSPEFLPSSSRAVRGNPEVPAAGG